MTTTTGTGTRPDTPAGVLAAARERRRAADAAEADLLQLAVDWVAMHPAETIHEPACYAARGFAQTDLALAGPGTPSIAEYAVAEFAAAVGLSTEAGKRLLGEAVELGYRLPGLWARVRAGSLPAWKARRVAAATIGLTAEAAGWVDRQLAPTAHKLKLAQLDRTVNTAIGRYMPDQVQRLAEASWDKRHVTVYDQLVSFTGTMHLDAELDIADALDLDAALAAGAAARAALGSTESLDVRRAQAVGDLARRQLTLDLNPDQPHGPTNAPDGPDSSGAGSGAGRGVRVKPRQVVLYLHLSHAADTGPHPGPDAGCRGVDPVARLERGEMLVTTDQVRRWCGHPDTQVTITPVLDLDTCLTTDADTPTDRIREQVTVRDRTCVFPWCTRPARRCTHDPDDHGCDHDHAVPRGRGGPTCSCNLAPLCRRHHRLKTHTPWRYVVLDPGSYLWTSPHGYQFLRDPTGTLDVTPDQPRPRADDPADQPTRPTGPPDT